jgi:hypothetical protein
MLLVLVVPPGSVTVVVTLSGPTIRCSALTLLCHWPSTLDVTTPADRVVLVGAH